MKKQLVILGPTASGKTALGVRACLRFNGELLSSDSRQFYRGMDLGTGKDLGEYEVDGNKVPFHLIDIAEAGDALNIYDYFKAYRQALKDILNRNRLPILCGGSGLYIETALRPNPYIAIPPNEILRDRLHEMSREELLEHFEKLPTKLRESQDSSTSKRVIRAIEIGEFLKSNPEPKLDLPDLDSLLIGVDIERGARRRRISERLESRMEEGLVEEVESLHASGVSLGRLKYYGLEYKCIALYLEGKLSLDEATKQLESEIHQFAKRQMTWFRGMERRGWKIHWLSWSLTQEEKLERISDLLT